MSCWSFYLALLQDSIKQLSILRGIYIFCGCTENWNAHLQQSFRKLDRRLATKLYHRPVRFFHLYNILYILRRQRLKIQFICNVKIGTHRLRIVINDNCLIPSFPKCPCAVHRTIVKLNSLPDADRTRSKYQNLLFIPARLCLCLAAKAGIIIGCLRGKFCRTGIYDLKGCLYLPLSP